MKNLLKLVVITGGFFLAAAASAPNVNAKMPPDQGECIGDRSRLCGYTTGGTELRGTWYE